MLHAAGDYEAAEQVLREALDARRELHGDRHPQTLETMTSLAVLLRDRGDLGAAEPLFREALASRRQTYGDENPHVLNTLGSLATLLHLKGDYRGAEQALQTVQSLARDHLIELHDAAIVTWKPGKKRPKTKQLTGSLEKLGLSDQGLTDLLRRVDALSS